VREQRFTIGRDRGCDVPIADDSVSRLHAEITFTDGDLIFLTDCRSSNGTYLVRGANRVPIRQEFVSPSDSVQFGDTVFRVEDLLSVIRRKHQKVSTDHLKGAGPEPAPAPQEWARGHRLVRCECGNVKVKGERCRMCGS
jgi:pSer/pThr/pTyr-binding forkhead associated (FHA) protein